LIFFRFNKIDSTQDEAKRGSYGERAVIVASEQTKGRGKPGAIWFSPRGGLYFSLILKPKKDVSDLLFITKLAADIVISLLLEYEIKAEIKLPNDVLVSGRKICGILVEKSKDSLIIGVGINVNIKEFPKGLNATSILLLAGKEINIDEVLSKFLETFNKEYLKLLGDAI